MEVGSRSRADLPAIVTAIVPTIVPTIVTPDLIRGV